VLKTYFCATITLDLACTWARKVCYISNF